MPPFEKNNVKGKPVEVETNNFTHIALGTYQDPVTQRWILVEIEFDPKTEVAQFKNKTEIEDGRVQLGERFKIRATETLAHFKFT